MIAYVEDSPFEKPLRHHSQAGRLSNSHNTKAIVRCNGFCVRNILFSSQMSATDSVPSLDQPGRAVFYATIRIA